MNMLSRNFLSLVTLLALSACNLFGPAGAVPGTSVLQLTVGTQTGTRSYSQTGEVITYQYDVTNTGISPLAGPVSITDPGRQVVCPEVNTVGNLNSFLDLNETVTCSATYTITDADINAGTLTSSVTATVGGVLSNASSISLTRSTPPPPSSVLTLSKTASSPTYGTLGQTITYTYVLTNAGTTALGPAQFTVTDNKLGAAFNCGQPNTTLAAGQTLNCSAPYIITQADLNSPNLTNTATASDGTHTSAPATTTVTNITLTQTPPITQPTTPAPAGNLTPGTTITHAVESGEWLYQIARCYGANIKDLVSANRQIPDPNVILQFQVVTVPNIGSAGPIYGRPCVTHQPAQSGDTWTSLAQRYNACVPVLQLANRGGITTGASMRIPVNSARLYCPDAASPGATPNPSITLTPSIGAQRITIDPGQTLARRIGIINPNETIRFVIAATQGQLMEVRLTAPANEVALGVNSPTGIALKPLDASPTWSATVTTTGDHQINLVAVLGSSSKSYTLEVSLTTPAVPTNTPGP